MSRFLAIFFIFLICSNYSLSQTNTALEEKIKINRETIKSNPDKGFTELIMLIEEARSLEDKQAELMLLSSKYNYYYFYQTDFNQMFNAARELQSKAVEYNSIKFQAVAHKYLAMAYLFNNLDDKAEEELQKGFLVLEKADSNDQGIIVEKASLYTFKINILIKTKKDYRSAIDCIYLASKEHEKLTNPELRRGKKFQDYSNLGAMYMELTLLDSAEYYTKKSISLGMESEANHDLTFVNYFVLGKVEKGRKNYDKALYYFGKAEEIVKNKHFINIKELYEALIEIHEIIGNQKEQDKYSEKLRDLELAISKKQNTALHSMLKEKEIVKPDNNNFLLIGIIGFSALALVTGLYIVRKRKKEKKEKHIQTRLSPEDYKELVEIARNNDTSFLLVFEKYYPGFNDMLLKINPEITDTEIDLLAMIKLKLTNKEIAQYRFIQPKTVQNRRHRVRKKLNLSNSVDLDKWVEDL